MRHSCIRSLLFISAVSWSIVCLQHYELITRERLSQERLTRLTAKLKPDIDLRRSALNLNLYDLAPEAASLRGNPQGEKEDRTKKQLPTLQPSATIPLATWTVSHGLSSAVQSTRTNDSDESRMATSGAVGVPDFCSSLASPLPRSTVVWGQHLHQILQWSIHPLDAEEKVFVPFTAKLLDATQHRMQRAIKTSPHRQWESVRSLLEVLHARQQYMQHNMSSDGEESIPRKVRILVLGGSVADGDKCNPIGVSKQEQRRRKCAWPFRLEFMINRFFQHDTVEVITATLGGTNTESSIMLMEYDLVPSEVDILIQAYTTNDMHLHSLEKAEAANVTLRDRVFDVTERFIRRALQRCRPSKRPAPLVIYFDDYIGNEQRTIRDSAVAAETVSFLANYYGILAVSYADAVRDIVYGDVWESWFSPVWFKRRPRFKFEFVRQVHPGMGMHIVSAWLILYGLLDTILSYCSSRQLHEQGSPNLLSNVLGNQTDFLPYREPKLQYGLPPRLYPDLSLMDVSDRWQKDSDAYNKNASVCSQSERCIFAWVSRITENCMWSPQLNATMHAHLVDNTGWEAVYDYFKLGWEATGGHKSRFALELTNVSQPISEIMLNVMKSYGTKWTESKIHLQVLHRRHDKAEWKPIRLTNSDVLGYHGKNTSEQYASVSKFRKGPVAVGSDLRLSIELVTGNTFKLMGMAVCGAS
jgi:hypothetical protein